MLSPSPSPSLALTLATGQTLTCSSGITGFELLEQATIRPLVSALPAAPIAIKLGETVYDLMTPLLENGTLQLLTLASPEALAIYRHTTAHVMAYALKNLFPTVKLAIGPPIENGFYYDVDHITLKEEHFKDIEAEMRALIKKKYKNERLTLSYKEALALFHNEPYKIDIITTLGEEANFTYYKMGNFIDLCKGPHLPNIGSIKGFQLDRLAGAYWRGNSKNPMLTRLYAHAFLTKTDLQTYRHQLAERERYDHNKIGREMGLFVNDPLVGQGLPLLTYKGTLVKQRIQTLVETEERRRGYLHTLTPYLAKSDLYKTSGHWEHYKDSMFIIKDGDNEFALRPMTCPFHFALYNSERRSYRDLPIRYAETSTLFRNEASGEMHGLIRVRQFTLSDGHIICTTAQLESEFKACLDLLLYFLKVLNFTDYSFRLSKWDPAEAGSKFIDNPALWEQTEERMRAICRQYDFSFTEAKGEAAFYGPKLDVQTTNVYGKEDTLLTIQIDFALPQRFKMTYIDAQDQKKQPVVIHRASIGCYERTIALLIEHYRGKLPFWLAPEQIALIPVHTNLHPYAKDLEQRLSHEGFYVTCYTKEESLGKRIRSAQKSKIPYLLILGEHEKATQTLSIRTRAHKTLKNIPLETFIKLCHKMQRNYLPTCLFTPMLTPTTATTPALRS